jgi:penicillin-binding protein 2
MEVRFPEDPRFPAWKIPLLQYIVAITFVFLLVGYGRLQIAEHAKYLEESQRNRIRELPIVAPRGLILDRNGRTLVDNTPAFSVLLSRDGSQKLTTFRIQRIAQSLDIDPADIEQQLQHAASLPGFQPVIIKKNATMQDVAFVESHHIEYPELDLIQVQERFYPKHEVAASVLGYVGDVSEDTIAQRGSPYHPGDVVGKSGIERGYDSVLSGTDGMRRVIVNSRGQEMGSMTAILPTPGHDLRLTIDLDLQLAAEQALGNKSGAVVALDPRTGQVLAMVSHPAVDPNKFAAHITAAQWKQLVDDPQKPLLNKAIQAQLAPGSVFKIVTAVAALETHTITPSFTVHCAGYVKIYGHTFHDWTWWVHHPAHGTVDLHRAIIVSCDVYFFTLGKMLGVDKIAYYAKHLGLGSRTGVDLPGEEPGLVPTPSWVERIFKHKWYAGETISMAIGQGALAVTPLQLAHMIGGVVSGGVFYRPHLVLIKQLDALGVDPAPVKLAAFQLAPATVQAVSQGMWGVVNQGGTGVGARVPGIEIAGKTGTAQVVSASFRRAGQKGNFKANAWFVGYAPASDPKIVVAVLVMHGAESSVAAPIASQVIKAYYEENGWPQNVGSTPKPAIATALPVSERGGSPRAGR